MSSTYSATETYSIADVEKVIKRVTTDLVMIATSTGGLSEAKAREYAYDIELLAKEGYLKSVDVTLLSGSIEYQAVRFVANTAARELSMSRPGGVLWPRVTDPAIRLVIFYTDAYTDAAREKMRPKLKISWGPTSADTSHSQLIAGGGRDYASNGYGIQRKDFSR